MGLRLLATWSRRLVVGLAVGSAVSGAAAESAAAGGTLVPVDAHIVSFAQSLAGPAFAGSSVVWSAPDPHRGYDVIAAGPGPTSSIHVDALGGGPVDPSLAIAEELAASPDAVVFGAQVRRCPDPASCKYMQFDLAQSEVFAGPLDQPLQLVGCGSTTTDPGGGPSVPLESVDVSGSEIAYLAGCAGGVTVRDLAAGSQAPWRTFPGDDRVRIAGHYVAIGSGRSSRRPSASHTP